MMHKATRDYQHGTFTFRRGEIVELSDAQVAWLAKRAPGLLRVASARDRAALAKDGD